MSDQKRKLSDLITQGMSMTKPGRYTYVYLDIKGRPSACALGAAYVALEGKDVFKPYEALEEGGERRLNQYISQEDILKKIEDATGVKLMSFDSNGEMLTTALFALVTSINDNDGREKALEMLQEKGL